LDYDECCCADVYSDGEIKILFAEKSFVPHKHRKGGQSAQRFSQNRDNAITLWFKEINQRLMPIDREIHLGISFVYKNRFLKGLHTYNRARIKEIHSMEYPTLSGIYQYVSKMEAKKKPSFK